MDKPNYFFGEFQAFFWVNFQFFECLKVISVVLSNTEFSVAFVLHSKTVTIALFSAMCRILHVAIDTTFFLILRKPYESMALSHKQANLTVCSLCECVHRLILSHTQKSIQKNSALDECIRQLYFSQVFRILLTFFSAIVLFPVSFVFMRKKFLNRFHCFTFLCVLLIFQSNVITIVLYSFSFCVSFFSELWQEKRSHQIRNIIP